MMKRILILSPVIFLAACGCSWAANMSGATYTITSSVISGGGGPVTSASGGVYEMNGTIGQPTPLADTVNPPTNNTGTTVIQPGFWNTVGGACPFDIEPDGDIDGADLAAFIEAGDFTQIQQFTGIYGSPCP